MRDEKLLKDLCELWGVGGYEKNVARYIKKIVEPYADELTVDAMGNMIVLKRGTGAPDGKKIMFAAHMDEIGFMVKKIEPDGRLRVCNMGWNWTSAAYCSKVRFANGIYGVVRCMGDPEDAHNDAGKLYIDIGATSREDALKYVKVGDCCAYCDAYIELVNDRIAVKAIDDRVGCYQLIQALKENDGSCPNDCYYVFDVQEELGCRGSQTAAARILPDVGISVDITPAHDYPCDLEGSNAVGEGIGVKICDPSVVSDEQVVAIMEACCAENGIPYQREVIDKGGTDSASMNRAGTGARTGGIVVVTRYSHTQSSVVAKSDIEAGVDLINAFSKQTIVWDEL